MREVLLDLKAAKRIGDILSLLTGVCRSAVVGEKAAWRVCGPLGEAGRYIQVSPSTSAAESPAQGWKLHVSASAQHARAVLELALPVLLAEKATFKVVASEALLAEMNEGLWGRSQVGKFITVYPYDEAHAVRLAVSLERATADLAGPPVPSDRALRPRGLVHYRYGSFTARWLQTPLGQVVPALRAPNGDAQPDSRGRHYRAPDWVTDPFVAAGVATEPKQLDMLVADRYLTGAILSDTLETVIRLTVDLVTGEPCVLKQARDTCDGHPHQRLRHEADIMRRLEADRRFPRLLDCFEQGGDLFLAMEYVEGRTIEDSVGEVAPSGRFVPVVDVVRWAREIARILGHLHAIGLVYGDLKPPHVIVTPQHEIRLLDLESACPPGLAGDWVVVGTAGYVSPQRAQEYPLAVTDDVYSFGALLYFLLTNSDPSHAPHRLSLLDRPVELLNPAAPASLVRIVHSCLDPNPARRPVSMRNVEAALSGSHGERVRSAPRSRRSDDATVRRLALDVCSAATPSADGPGLVWDADLDGSPVRRDIDGGMAGIILVLSEALKCLAEPPIRRVLRLAAQWLVRSQPLPGGPLPGLYIGEAGIGLALLRAGEVLEEDTLISAALEKGDLVGKLPHVSPDLFNGTAGRLRYHLLLAAATGEGRHVNLAAECGEWLVACANEVGRNELEWRTPPGYGSGSGHAFLGYAHGVAGIADTLLDLFEVTGRPALLRTVQGATRRLLATVKDTLTDATGLDWPNVEDGSVGGQWCNGAAGVARFLLHAQRLDVLPDLADVARRTIRTVGEGARWVGPSQCHGLAGNIEVLVDYHQLTGDEDALRDANQLCDLLSAYLFEDDQLRPSSLGALASFDFMKGRAGVLACQLRMNTPERPHLLAARSAAAVADT